MALWSIETVYPLFSAFLILRRVLEESLENAASGLIPVSTDVQTVRISPGEGRAGIGPPRASR